MWTISTRDGLPNLGSFFVGSDFLQSLQINLILKTIRGPLHFQKHFKSYDTRIDPRSNWLLDSSIVFEVEVERLVNKNVNWSGFVLITVQLKNKHSLLTSP